jgi:uncharacterized protein YggE
MRKILIVILLVFLFLNSLLAASCTITGETATAQSDILQVKNTITVQGTASITVTPTIAYVNIGVTTFDKDAGTAQSNNAEKMNNVYKALEDLGIIKEKIKTTSYYISPRYEYDYNDNTSTMIGYDVTNMIQVTVEDLNKVSQVLDLSVEQGVNEATSISFGITDQENDETYVKALEAAVNNAKGKAVALATAAGLVIDKPLQIIEGAKTSSIPIYSYEAKSVEEDVATPISGGALKVVANVTLVYSY